MPTVPALVPAVSSANFNTWIAAQPVLSDAGLQAKRVQHQGHMRQVVEGGTPIAKPYVDLIKRDLSLP